MKTNTKVQYKYMKILHLKLPLPNHHKEELNSYFYFSRVEKKAPPDHYYSSPLSIQSAVGGWGEGVKKTGGSRGLHIRLGPRCCLRCCITNQAVLLKTEAAALRWTGRVSLLKGWGVFLGGAGFCGGGGVSLGAYNLQPLLPKQVSGSFSSCLPSVLRRPSA